MSSRSFEKLRMHLPNASLSSLNPMRLSLMASHLSTSDGASSRAPSLSSLNKTNTFTSRLPPDPRFPSPKESHDSPRAKLLPELVRGGLYTFVRPTKVEEPKLLAVSPVALRDLGISEDAVKDSEFLDVVSGNRILGWDGIPDGGESEEEPTGKVEEQGTNGESKTKIDSEPGTAIYPWAQIYGGFQFGQWAGQLGDGRAHSLFETTNPETKVRYEVQLKGGGRTPYSRFADGRAVLRSSIREFIISETLNALGIKTTRALSLVHVPKLRVIRERIEPAAIVCRFAQSWLRFGTFDLLRARGERDLIRQLSEYVAVEVYGGWDKLPEPLPGKDVASSTSPSSSGDDNAGPSSPYSHLNDDKILNPGTSQSPKGTTGSGDSAQNRFARLYRAIARANAATVAQWQVYGFTNGVLNTDNTSILGLSLDFGPFSFIDVYEPSFTPNHDDHMLRYAYRAQPSVIWWNLVRLGESLGELIGLGGKVDEEKYVKEGVSEDIVEEVQNRGERIIMDTGEEYKAVFMAHFRKGMASRLGFKSYKEGDFDAIFTPWLDTLEECELDFNHSFRRLGSITVAELASEEGRTQAAARFFRTDSSAPPIGLDEAKKKVAAWLEKWRSRVVEDWGEDADNERKIAMDEVNPKVRSSPALYHSVWTNSVCSSFLETGFLMKSSKEWR
jgi:serine/tyrosine/threonine adenylyltransferase